MFLTFIDSLILASADNRGYILHSPSNRLAVATPLMFVALSTASSASEPSHIHTLQYDLAWTFLLLFAGEAQLKGIAAALGVPLGSVKQMAYKRRALLTLSPEEVMEKVQQLSSILEVPQEQAKAMVAIQPGLLFETQVSYGALWGVFGQSY